MPIEAALDAAREVGLDLVEVSPNDETPVCKIVDYGKMRYEAQKKKAAAKKKTENLRAERDQNFGRTSIRTTTR